MRSVIWAGVWCKPKMASSSDPKDLDGTSFPTKEKTSDDTQDDNNPGLIVSPQRRSPEICQNCLQYDSTNYCQDCFMLLCDQCSCEHPQLKSFSDHKLISMEDYYDLVYSSNNLDCPTHDRSLFLYCLTCNCCICQKCRIGSGHDSHSFKLTSDYIQQDVIGGYDAQIEELEEKMASLRQEREEVILEGEATKAKIALEARKMLDKLMAYQRQICEKVEDDKQRKMRILKEQQEDADAMMKELNECAQYVQATLHFGTPEQVLMEKDKLMEEVARVTKKASEKNYEPLVEPDITITRN